MSDQNNINEVFPITNGHHHESDSANSTSSSTVGDAEQHQERILQPAQRSALTSRESSRLTGTVKWFNAKAGYGFITRSDNFEDIFIHYSGIGRKNPRHAIKSLGDGEIVEFNLSATNVTGIGGRAVRGHPYVSYLPVRRNDSFASGDPIVMTPNRRYVRGVNAGNSRIPRFNWQ